MPQRGFRGCGTCHFKRKEVNRDNKTGRDDLVHITCMTWVTYTSFSHPMNYGNKCSSRPTIAWGKYFLEGEKMILPLSVMVHHSLVDGLHVGRFYERLQALLDSAEELF